MLDDSAAMSQNHFNYLIITAESRIISLIFAKFPDNLSVNWVVILAEVAWYF